MIVSYDMGEWREIPDVVTLGLHALEHLADMLHGSERFLLLCGMRDQPARMMERAEFHEHIGTDNMLPSVEAALDRARGLLRETDRSALRH